MRQIMYNGLSIKERQMLADFIYVYETQISEFENLKDFALFSQEALLYFDETIRPFAMKKGKGNRNGKTLFYSVNKNLLLDFCRHLRNSFVHAKLIKQGGQLQISDKSPMGCSCEGFLEDAVVMSFIKKIVESYQK